MTKTLEEMMADVLQVSEEKNNFENLSVTELEEIVKTAGVGKVVPKALRKPIERVGGAIDKGVRSGELPKTVAKGLAIGGTAYLGARAGASHKEKKSSISEETVKEWAKELARNEKIAGLMGTMGKAVGEAGKKVMKAPATKRALVGGAVGAGTDAVTNRNSSLGSMAAAGGIGAAAGHFAPQGLKAVAKNKSEFGRAVKSGLKGK